MKDETKTIVYREPKATLQPAIGSSDCETYLTHIEKCGRISHLSESKNAEKFVTKVVNNLNHISIIEHVWHMCTIKLHDAYASLMFYHKITQVVPLLAASTRILDAGTVTVSGNLRMWRELFEDIQTPCWITKALAAELKNKYPLIFAHICYGKEDKRVSGTLADPRNIKTDPAQVALTFHILGSRDMSHQVVRHRMAAFTQESQRYINYNKKPISFIAPNEDKTKSSKVLELLSEIYTQKIQDGMKPEDARAYLPNATKTELYMTLTLKEWQHVIEMRALNKHAQSQIRNLMLSVKNQIQEIVPSFMEGE